MSLVGTVGGYGGLYRYKDGAAEVVARFKLEHSGLGFPHPGNLPICEHCCVEAFKHVLQWRSCHLGNIPRKQGP